MEKDPPIYKEPRGPSIVNGIVDILNQLGMGGLNFGGLFNKVIIARNKLFAEIYPLLLERDQSGMNRLERFDAAYNARIQKAVQDFETIRKSFDNLGCIWILLIKFRICSKTRRRRRRWKLLIPKRTNFCRPWMWLSA
ncbi:MAG: hypothetical protein LBO77_05125 [Desulfovibrio sp.]|nr:hypothetical protein [Desulfovibrio sp.]